MSTQKKVVIIGGQFAGRKALTLLEKDFDVTIIDEKEYFEYTPAALRAIVEPAHAAKIIVDRPRATKVARAERIELTDGSQSGSIALKDGTSLPFDYLLLCCGSSYSSPVKSTASEVNAAGRIASYQAAYQRVAKAASVVVVGGGTVGVELAAEVVGKFGRTKAVTLIGSSPRLLDRLPEKAGEAAKKWLESNGVQVLLGQRVVELAKAVAQSDAGETAEVTTDAGRVVKADLVYSCVTYAPTSSLLESTSLAGSDYWQAGKPIPVLPTLQVKGLPAFVFAAGDCTDSPEEKTAFAADLAATLAAKNIIRLAAEQPLLRYPQDLLGGLDSVPVVGGVSLYKYTGIMVMNEDVQVGFVPGIMKGIIAFFIVGTVRGTWWVSAIWARMKEMTLGMAIKSAKQ